MDRALISTFKRAFVGSLCAFLMVQSGAADEKTSPAERQTEAAKTLERILQEAGDKGLLELGSHKDVEPPEPKVVAPPVAPDFDCLSANAINLWRYDDIESYDDVLKAKSGITDYKTQNDVIPVAQTFLALGLGTEAVATLSAFDSPEVKFLSALGQVVDGTSSAADVELLASYAPCGVQAKFWSRIAQSALVGGGISDPDWNFTRAQLDMLSELPSHLGEVLTVQVGIHAAELGNLELADQLFSMIDPASKFGDLPKSKSDARLFLYALVRQSKGDAKGAQVLDYLAKKDGVYQARALLKLVQNEDLHDSARRVDLHAGLLSVQQQYKGNSQARKASLEIVRQQAQERQFIYGIDMAKKEFLPENAEYQLAIDSLGAVIKDDLIGESAGQKLTALNGYLYDPDFFAAYVEAGLLQYRAHKSAVDLNFPEIANHMIQTAALASENAEKLEVDGILANLKIAMKEQDYDRVVELGLPHIEDVRFREILVKAAFKQQPDNASYQIASALNEGAEKFAFQAEIAAGKSDWKNAETALSALENLKKDDFDKAQTLSIVKYVAADESADKSIARLSTVKDVQKMQQGLGSDIDLVRAFLTNG